MHALDLETAPNSGDLSNGWALEPWRARQGKARITSLAVYGDKVQKQIIDPDRNDLIALLEELDGEEVYAHWAIFDIAWLIASIEPNKMARLHRAVTRVRWRDTALLAKWCINGRKADDMHFSYALLNLINVFKAKMGYEGADEFIRMKQAEALEQNEEYWQKRGLQDVLWTYRLAKFLESQLPPVCRRGFIIEQRALAQMANSWLIGIYVNEDALKKAESQIESDIAAGCAALGLSEAVVGSPAQLGRVVFGSWGYQPLGLTPGGQPKADADTWIILAYQHGDERLKTLLKTRQALTLRSKYIRTAYDALAHTGDGYLYGKPQLFGATSGRLTMSSETIKGIKVSIAQHQIPRKDKIIRAYLSPPPGYKIFETDANAQESRIMGIWSRDEEHIRVFNSGINFHSNMACEIYSIPYETFQDRLAKGDLQTIEFRQMGKLTNLSCNYRIGGKKLALKSLTEYDSFMTEMDGRKLTRTFQRKYPGVPAYWSAIIEFARQNGYAYTLAQRRWKVPVEMLNSGDAWKVEGTIISHPIQGTGGEMFLAAISQVPDARMQTSLHDGIFWMVEDSPAGQQEADDILQRMNATPYAKLWDIDELPIPLLYDGTKLGSSYADVK